MNINETYDKACTNKKNLEKLQIYLQNEMITVITRVP